MQKIGEVLSVPIGMIDKMECQPEERHEKVDKMAEDISKRGMIYPIKLTPYVPRKDGDGVEKIIGDVALQNPRHRFLVVDGHRRLWAHEILRIKEIAALLVLDKNYREILRMWMTANSKRLAPNPYDMAKFIKHYSEVSRQELVKSNPALGDGELGRLVMDDLCDASGFSESFFRSRLAILTAPKPIQQMIRREASRGSLPAEVNHSIPKRYRSDVYNSYIDGHMVSTLDPRPLGKQLWEIEEDAQLSDAVKVRRAKAVIRTFRGKNSKQVPTDVRLEAYHNNVDGLRRTILSWDLHGLGMTQLDELTTALADLQVTFRELRRQAGLLPRGK